MAGVPGRLPQPGEAGVYKDAGWRALPGVIRGSDLGDRAGTPASELDHGCAAVPWLQVREGWGCDEGGEEVDFFGNLGDLGEAWVWRGGSGGAGWSGRGGGGGGGRGGVTFALKCGHR